MNEEYLYMHKLKSRKKQEERGKWKKSKLGLNVKTLELMSIPEGKWTKVVTQPGLYTKTSLT